MKKVILLIVLAVLVISCDCNCTYPKKLYIESSHGYNYIIQTDSAHTYIWRDGIITKLE